MKPESSLISISQGQLNLLETCPPQFQRIYLEELASPPTPQQQERLTWGSRFHLLMQQRELGLPIESLTTEDQEMGNSLKALIDEIPELVTFDSNNFREAEHNRTLVFNDYLFTVIYDLLIAEKDKAKILDWKTYFISEDEKKLVKERQKLAKNWQTRLYFYVLAETSDYSPEQISMTYWFVKLPHKPQSLTFTYNIQQHQQTYMDLKLLLSQLDRYHIQYLEEKKDFPHRPDCKKNCPYYKIINSESVDFPKKCDKNWQKILTEIEEISL